MNFNIELIKASNLYLPTRYCRPLKFFVMRFSCIYLGIEVFQKLIFSNIFYQFLILNKILTILKPTFRKPFKTCTWKFTALKTVTYFLFLATQMKFFAFLTSCNINFCTRTWFLFSCVCWTSSTKNTTCWNPSIISLIFSHTLYMVILCITHKPRC